MVLWSFSGSMLVFQGVLARPLFFVFGDVESKESLKPPSNELDEELADFLKHCQSNPGRPYKVSRIEQFLV